MKTVLLCNEVEKDTITHNGHKIDEAEGDADPDVVLLKSRDAQKGKGTHVVASYVVYGHWNLINRFCVLKQIVYNYHMPRNNLPLLLRAMLIFSEKILKY